MKTAFKWIAIIGGGLVVLCIVALLVIPLFVDIESFKPQIEDRIIQATGRPFALKGNLDLSLFPWSGIALSDLHLGNTPDFKEEDFVSIKTFEVRVKLFPLLFKDIQVKRFIVKEPRIVLVKDEKGKGNWEGLLKTENNVPTQTPVEKEKIDESNSSPGLFIRDLTVGEFAITNGRILWIDHTSGTRKEISDLSLILENVSLDQAIQLKLSALADKLPFMIAGSVGPIGKDIGKGALPLDLSVKAIEQLDIDIKGSINDLIGNPKVELSIQAEPFSLRKAFAAMDQPFPITTTDPDALNRISLSTAIKANMTQIALSDGLVQLDQSDMAFSVTARDFAKPAITFNLNVDEIDLDRYLPPPDQDQEKQEIKKPPPEKSTKTDYEPLRSIVLDGIFSADRIRIKNAKIENLDLKINGKNGVFNLAPLKCDLYQGHVEAKGSFDVQKAIPNSQMAFQIANIQTSPLLKDVLEKDYLTGVVDARMNMRIIGDDPDSIKKSLNGNGEFLFKDGTIKGIDLAGMINNLTSSFGLAKDGGETSGTDFTEFRVPFNIIKGIFNTSATSLASPLLRVIATGNADLVKETLNFRVEPKFVATLKGQGDTTERSGIAVPVMIKGTFTSPKFIPDLENILKQNLSGELPDLEDLRKTAPENVPKALEEKAKDLFKNFPFGK